MMPLNEREMRPCVWGEGLENRCCFSDENGYCNLGLYDYIENRTDLPCEYNYTAAEIKELIGCV